MLLRGLTALLLLPALFACGCGSSSKSTYITRYPVWDWESYDRIAVIPFAYPESEPHASEPARHATFTLDDMLAANGNFTVLERAALSDVVAEQDLSQLADIADPSTLLPPGKVKIAQALVVGKLASCDTKAERVEKRVPVFAVDRKGRIRHDRYGRAIVAREKVVQYFQHQGTVAGSVRVIDAATGKVLFAHTVPAITHEDSERGRPPDMTPEQLAIEAARELALDCYTHLAPVQIKVKLKSDMLICALDYYDGAYDKTKKISTELDEFMLVVRELPKACERNPFRVAIAPEEGRNIWEEEFTWTAANPVRGVTFNVPVEMLASAGAEKFVAKLYSGNGEQPVLKREFKLVPPDED